jgi:hypothetical protein
MYRQEDQDSKWFATPAMATNIKKAKIDRSRAAATEELRCCGQLIHFVFILVGFSPCSHWSLFLLQTGQTSQYEIIGVPSEGMERGVHICHDHINQLGVLHKSNFFFFWGAISQFDWPITQKKS